MSLILIRHTDVAADWQGRCYGASDVALSPSGEAAIAPIAAELAATGPARVIDSGRQRARRLAHAIAGQANCACASDERLCELNFGAWEGQSWSDIFAAVGHDMARLIHEPDAFAPPDGETVHAMRRRVVAAVVELGRTHGTILVTHGGPISAVRGTLANRPAKCWPGLVPDFGRALPITHDEIRELDAWQRA